MGAPWNESAFLFHWGASVYSVKLRKHYFTGARDFLPVPAQAPVVV